MEIRVIPLGTLTPSVSAYVGQVIALLRKEKDIRIEVSSMGTNVESPSLKRLLSIALKMHEKMFSSGALRVLTTITIDDRRDTRGSIARKRAAIRPYLYPPRRKGTR